MKKGTNIDRMNRQIIKANYERKEVSSIKQWWNRRPTALAWIWTIALAILVIGEIFFK